jgi:Phage integrase, N-terminal SAM-like domain
MIESGVEGELKAVAHKGTWALAGASAAEFSLANEYLSYLADRRYSPRTVRAYAFDLLHFCRWLMTDGTALDAVSTDTLLRFLAECREAVLPGQHGGNVVDLRSGRSAGYAPATVNRRMAAVSGLFTFRSMRDPTAQNPVPRGAAARGRPRVPAQGCSVTWPSRDLVPSSVSGNRDDSREDWTKMKPGICGRVCARIGTGPWPG